MSEDGTPALGIVFNTAKLISAAGSIAFAIGMLYDYGYFVGLDRTFFALLNYQDHVTALIFFAAPCLCLALIFGTYWSNRWLHIAAGGFGAVIVSILTVGTGLPAARASVGLPSIS